jgi:hypothetical protein
MGVIWPVLGRIYYTMQGEQRQVVGIGAEIDIAAPGESPLPYSFETFRFTLFESREAAEAARQHADRVAGYEA